MAESFFCRVRKSAFDTVEGCKDIVKDKIQEQSFKAASTIVLEPEATEIVNVLVKHLGMGELPPPKSPTALLEEASYI